MRQKKSYLSNDYIYNMYKAASIQQAFGKDPLRTLPAVTAH